MQVGGPVYGLAEPKLSRTANPLDCHATDVKKPLKAVVRHRYSGRQACLLLFQHCIQNRPSEFQWSSIQLNKDQARQSKRPTIGNSSRVFPVTCVQQSIRRSPSSHFGAAPCFHPCTVLFGAPTAAAIVECV